MLDISKQEFDILEKFDGPFWLKFRNIATAYFYMLINCIWLFSFLLFFSSLFISMIGLLQLDLCVE